MNQEQFNKQYANFFEELGNRSPFFKFASHGLAGSGKTYTSALIAVGLYKKIQSKKPVVIFDTEQSSKFLKPLFDKNGIHVIVKVSRTLPDLMKSMDFCDSGGADILIIDSITHVYEDFLESYKKKKNRSFIQFQDWGFIKPAWKSNFSDRLVNSRCHILFTGRQGYTYENVTNEETGKVELIKSGVKMKAEGETPYEPDVLVVMERFENLLGDKKEVWREATIIKDRSTLLDGMTIKNPTFESFEPVIDFLLDKPEPRVDTETTANEHIINDEETNYAEKRDRRITQERNIALLDEVAGGTGKEEKALRLSLIKYAYYGETSAEAIGMMNLGQLEEANSRLTEIVPVIYDCLKAEKRCLDSKQVAGMRIQHLGTDNLGDAKPAELSAYLEAIGGANAN